MLFTPLERLSTGFLTLRFYYHSHGEQESDGHGRSESPPATSVRPPGRRCRQRQQAVARPGTARPHHNDFKIIPVSVVSL
jgi:hypothetical protein